MRGLSLENIIAACHGDYFGDMELLRREVSAITTDSRKVESGCLFAAIAGERVDGHDFIPAVMEAGALCAFASGSRPSSIHVAKQPGLATYRLLQVLRRFSSGRPYMKSWS